jgi:hypothetical protein
VTPAAADPGPRGAGRWGKGGDSAGTTRSARRAGGLRTRSLPRPSSGGWGWGRAVKGQETKSMRKGTQSHPPSTTKPTREQRVIFAPQNLEIQGPSWGPMDGNQQTAPAEAIDGDWLLRSTNQVRGAPSSPGAVPLSTLVAQLGLGREPRRSPAPGAAFARPSRSRPRPRQTLELARAACSFSVGTEHHPGAAHPFLCPKLRPEVRKGR